MHLTLAPSFPSLSLALFALFTSPAFDYQNDKRLAGVIIACTALYVMNFAYSVRQCVLSFSFLAAIWSAFKVLPLIPLQKPLSFIAYAS